MSKHEEEGFCPHCFARDVGLDVLHEFTEVCPKVKMSYEDWMILHSVIEDKIKERLGVPTEEGEPAEKPVMQ